MNGRNYQGIAGLMPGVVNTSQGSALGTGGRSTNSVLSINGLDTSRSFYVLDGIWNENSGNMQQTSVVPNPDSLEEVRVLQNNFSAQYSLMGSSVIVMQTKSGTSNFHATAWEFWRNNALNTRPYFTLVSAGIPSYKQNIFGYNLGGPIFIPHHYNADRQKTSSMSFCTCPTRPPAQYPRRFRKPAALSRRRGIRRTQPPSSRRWR
jgi:hypothetical protein